MIITAIRNDEQRLFWVFRLPHFTYTQVNRVQERGSPFRNRKNQLALNIFNRLGEVRDFLRLVREGNHKELILRIGGLEKLGDRLPGAINLAAHAAAHVKYHADGDWGVLTG